MKRILGLILLLVALSGCTAAPEPDETTAPPVTVPVLTEPTEPAGIYVPFSDLEAQTEGTVRYYLPESSCYGIRMMGSDVLAFCGEENTTLIRYAGEQLYAIAGIQLGCRVDPEDTSFQISSNGITYYDSATCEVVFLDNDLKEVRRLAMPGQMQGKPVLSANRMQVFYCTSDAVRVYDTTTGLDKLLKSISYPRQSVENVLLNDSVLHCALVDEKGTEYAAFISAQTGELISQVTTSGISLSAEGERYYAKVSEGIQQLLVFGGKEADEQVLTPADPFAESWFLESSHGVVTAAVTQEDTTLDLYDLDSGLRTASVELPGGILPKYMQTQPDTDNLIVMAYDYMAEAPVICVWNTALTPAGDDMQYSGPRYTAEEPDVEGLNTCATLAQNIGQKYGLRILVGREAVDRQPWDYTLEMEYQTGVIRRQLETLEKVLSHFPEDFFSAVYGDTGICIVRTIRGNAESGSVASAQGLQFWDGENAYVALAAGDTLEGAFFHEIFHVLDSKILSETRVYYYWHNLNPKGCEYFEDYTSYLEADVSEYLEDENRVFIDAYSMCYPKEDRARIMEYACQEGNEHYFQSEIMQKKLETLCQGIRKAFGLETYPDSFLWEQYLNEPLMTK